LIFKRPVRKRLRRALRLTALGFTPGPLFCYYISVQKDHFPHARINRPLGAFSLGERAARRRKSTTDRERIPMSNPLDDRKKALEEDYFRRKEQEAIEKLRAKMKAEEQTKAEEAALLQCPRCDGRLIETTIEEVKIDRCSKCMGIWLDAGELEQLTRRESGGWFSRLWDSSADKK
jgi:uncharacterized protein